MQEEQDQTVRGCGGGYAASSPPPAFSPSWFFHAGSRAGRHPGQWSETRGTPQWESDRSRKSGGCGCKLTVCFDPMVCIWIVAFKIPVPLGVCGHPVFPRWVWIHSCLTGCTDALNMCYLLSAHNPSRLNQDKGIPGRNGGGGWTQRCISLFAMEMQRHPAQVPVTLAVAWNVPLPPASPSCIRTPTSGSDFTMSEFL